MLCCFRRRGKYTTTVVSPDYKERQKPQSVPFPGQNPPASRPESTSTPFATVGAAATQNKPAEPLKTIQESVNNANSVDKAKPTKIEEKPEPVTAVPPVNSVEKLNPVKGENTVPVTDIQEKINPVKSVEKINPAKRESTQAITEIQDNIVQKEENIVTEVQQISKPPVNPAEKTNSRKGEDTLANSEENINPFNFLVKSTSGQNENTEPVIEAQDNSNSVNHIEETKSEEHEVAVVKETRSTKEENTGPITNDQEITKSDNFGHDTNIETTVISTTTREESNTQKNTQSDKVQGNINNILAAASLILTQHQNEQSKTQERIEQEDMERNRTKIRINVDNTDIMGDVPLTPRRSILMQSSSMEPDIDEEQEGVEEEEHELEKGIGQHSKVTFGKVNEYYTQEQKEGNYTQEPRKGIREAITVDTTMEIPKYPKSAEEIENLKEALASNEFLHNVLRGETLSLVIEAMYERQVLESEVITQEGEPGRNMYVSESGEYEIYVKKKLFDTFDDRRVFGELAILYDTKRKATIKAVTNGKVWVLQRDVYQQILVQRAIKDFEENLEFLKNVPLINKLDEESLKRVAHLLRKEFFKTDTRIIQEGDPGDKFYIIRAGTVTVTKEGVGVITEMARGEFFGERALLRNFNRQANVFANAPGVECLTLMQSDFNDHFDAKTLNPELEDEEQTDVKSTDELLESIYQSAESYEDVVLEDLERKAILGVGGFGRVELVRHKANENLVFALKVLKKAEVMQRDQMEHVFNEKDVQMNCYSPFIVRLYKTFKDEKYLYFLLESCLGGDLWNYLQTKKNRQVSEDDACFYTACVLEGLAYLHERNFVYRDLKPENMLFSSNGYLKLADFGFAKRLNTGDKSYTFNGTLEYLAPEIITNNGHDKAVDYWALGIFIFELLVGHAPFRTGEESSMQAFNSILRGIKSVPFPKHVSKNATNLIQKLCRAIPTERLGNQKGGAQDVRTHRWFKGFDWFALRKQHIVSPFLPDLESNIDTKYFGHFDEDTDDPPKELENFGDF